MPNAAEDHRDSAIVYVIDSDAWARATLQRLLSSFGVVRTFEKAADYLALDHPGPVPPSCLVADARLPDISGLDLQRLLLNRGDTLPLIFMTDESDVPVIVQAIKAGAVEFLLKPFPASALHRAVELALQIDALTHAERLELAGIRQCMAALSRREREVMTLIVNGYLNKQVAAQLDIAEITVKVHRRRVMDKMGARSFAELVRIVQRIQSA